MAFTEQSTLHPDEITAGLDTDLLPSKVICYPQVGSTMDVVRQGAAAGAAEGLLVLAEEQTAGRGRMGRPWASPVGSNLYLSLLLRPFWLPPSDAFYLTMLVAVSLCAAVESLTPLAAQLKWPNDLLLPRSPHDGELAKAAGILVELSLRSNSLGAAIVGCGINVNSHPPADEGLRYPATSLAAACGRPVERVALLRAFLRAMDANYVALRAGRGDEIFALWRARLVTIGTDVRIETPAGLVAGCVEGVAPSGALLVRTDDGTLSTITTGDVAA